MTQYTDTIAETVNATPALTVGHPAVVAEAMDMGSSTAESVIIEVIETQAAQIGTSAIGVVNLNLSDGVTLTFDELILARAYAVLATDTFNTSPTVLGAHAPTLLEDIEITDTDVPTTTFSVGLAQLMRPSDTATTAYGLAATDAVAFTSSTSFSTAVAVAEALNLTTVITPSAIYGRTFNDGVVLTDSLRRFLDGSVADAMDLSATPLPAFRYGPAVSDTVNVSEGLTPRLILRATMAEGVDITAAELLNGVYTGSLSDGIELVAGYLSPGDTFTTWVVNTVTGATTEYDNFQFNSFAGMGRRYLGANSSGLYALDGDTDDGADIISTIKSGLLQLTGARFTSFRGAYIGVRTDEEGAQQFTLKLVTGDGSERVYAVNVRDQETTKVHLGRGLRARYISFELVSTGQDFDLDSLEFVPIVSSRRV